ncbi:hypothetical protein HDC34_001925 [Pseudoclavibacter sp. JAI123]|nr:hypothetical protein [Pseudoclavibacter sp. JAI123]
MVAAWTAPVVALSVAPPARAASGEPPALTFQMFYRGPTGGGYLYEFTLTNGTPNSVYSFRLFQGELVSNGAFGTQGSTSVSTGHVSSLDRATRVVLFEEFTTNVLADVPITYPV